MVIDGLSGMEKAMAGRAIKSALIRYEFGFDF
jgi:hypothetical protein